MKKNQGFNGIRTRDLRDTGAMLYQLSYEATHWNLRSHVDTRGISTSQRLPKQTWYETSTNYPYTFPNKNYCAVPVKYPYLPHGRSMEILRGVGVSKAKFFFKKSMLLNWNFQRG